MFMLAIGFPLIALVVFSLVLCHFSPNPRFATVFTGFVFAVGYTIYSCLLTDGWKTHFVYNGVFVFVLSAAIYWAINKITSQ